MRRGLADRRTTAATCKSGQEARNTRRHAAPSATWICVVREVACYPSSPLATTSLCAIRSANCCWVLPTARPSSFRYRPNHSGSRACPRSRPHFACFSLLHLSCAPCARGLSCGFVPVVIPTRTTRRPQQRYHRALLCRHQPTGTRRCRCVLTPPTERQE